MPYLYNNSQEGFVNVWYSVEMKTIYLVRHGESESNVGPIPELEAPELTENGQAQARSIARRAKNLPIDLLVASTSLRAQQTAGFISTATGLTIQSSPLFTERRRASIQVNKSKDHPDFIEAETARLANFGVPGYRHSDEETFEDLSIRAEAALEYLKLASGEHIMVVSHGLFLRTLIAKVIFGPNLTAYECNRFMLTTITQNTGLTVLVHDSGAHEPWKLKIWNDHAHLG